MSRVANDSNQAKADQIAYRFYHKFLNLLLDARNPQTPHHSSNTAAAQGARSDKWFNLDLPDPDQVSFTDVLRPYRSLSTTDRVDPLVLHVLLDVPPLPANQVLVSLNGDGHGRTQITPTPSYVVLETWVLAFTPSATPPQILERAEEEIQLPTVYKTSLSLFRSLYTLLRILPVWDLSKRLRRSHSSPKLSISLHLSPDLLPNTLPFPSSGEERNATIEQFVFPPVSHPYGSLSVTAHYLKESACNFSLSSLEALLSSRLLIVEEFTPTLSRNALSFTPGSLPLRTSLPKSGASPPTQGSLADRFITRSPTISRTTSAAAAANAYPPQPFPSSGSSQSPPTNMPRPRSPSTAPVPVSVRRPSLTSSPTSPVALNPFRSSTVVPSSSSPRASSPLTSGLVRPSPPNYTPSSLGDRRSISTGTPSSIHDPRPTLPGAVPISTAASGSVPKRYSSSFSHRYAQQHGAGSEGSGSGSLGGGGASGSVGTGIDQPRGPSSFSPTGLGFSPSSLPVGSSSSPSHRPRTYSSSPRNAPSQLPPPSPRIAPVVSLAMHPIAPPTLTSLNDVDREIQRMMSDFNTALEGIVTDNNSGNGNSKGKGRASPSATGLGLQLGGGGPASPTSPPPQTSTERDAYFPRSGSPKYMSSPRNLPSPLPPTSPTRSTNPFSTPPARPVPIPQPMRPRTGSSHRRPSYDTFDDGGAGSAVGGESDDYYTAGSGSGGRSGVPGGGSEEIIGRMDIDEYPYTGGGGNLPPHFGRRR